MTTADGVEITPEMTVYNVQGEPLRVQCILSESPYNGGWMSVLDPSGLVESYVSQGEWVFASKREAARKRVENYRRSLAQAQEDLAEAEAQLAALGG